MTMDPIVTLSKTYWIKLPFSYLTQERPHVSALNSTLNWICSHCSSYLPLCNRPLRTCWLETAHPSPFFGSAGLLLLAVPHVFAVRWMVDEAFVIKGSARLGAQQLIQRHLRAQLGLLTRVCTSCRTSSCGSGFLQEGGWAQKQVFQETGCGRCPGEGSVSLSLCSVDHSRGRPRPESRDGTWVASPKVAAIFSLLCLRQRGLCVFFFRHVKELTSAVSFHIYEICRKSSHFESDSVVTSFPLWSNVFYLNNPPSLQIAE